jgi:membrane dipeptidase
MTDSELNRRAFVSSVAAASGVPILLKNPLGAARQSARWDGYDDAVVIDFLASPGYFNYPLDPPLDDVMVANARRSGVTAVNLTVSQSTFRDSVRKISSWMKNIERFPDDLTQVRTVADLDRAKSSNKFGIVFGFQDTTPIEGDLENLTIFQDLGVRVVQLTYNVRNLVGDGCLEPANGGLSRFGHSVVERMNEIGMLVDLSHCGQKTTADGISASSTPVAITHSGCNAVARHPRSKDDTELRALANGGGVIGIYLMPFLTPGRPALADDVVAHIEHALNVCGEDHVGIGSDLSTTPIDGSDEYWRQHRNFVARRIAAGVAAPNEDPEILFTVGDINDARRMELIADKLSERGHRNSVIGKVIGENWKRLLGEIW